MQTLTEITNWLLTGGKGLPAMDESTGTCDKGFAAFQIPETEGASKLIGSNF